MSNVVYQPFHEMWPIGHFTQKRGEQIPDILIYREQTFPETCPHQTSPTTRFTFTVPPTVCIWNRGCSQPIGPSSCPFRPSIRVKTNLPNHSSSSLGIGLPLDCQGLPLQALLYNNRDITSADAAQNP